VSSGAATRAYGRGARILSIGIATTGLVTFAYFALASHSLSEVDYKGLSVLWSALFLIISIIYRPVEQLLSHTISSRRAQGHEGHPLRVPLIIQASTATLFLVAALALREPIQDDVFDGSAELYWVLVVAVLAYAASYFARGWLAGHQRFGLYGGLVLLESCSRCLFALAVAIGIAEGQTVVALGMAAAPIVSLAVVPPALARRLAPRAAASDPDTAADPDPAMLDAAAREEPTAREPEFTLGHGAGFAAAVLLIMLCEQTFLNAGPLLVKATEGASGAALAGFTFNVLLIARAPLQLFQAIQTSILPHLTHLRASGESDPFRRSVNVTLTAIAGFAGCVAIVMLVAGPPLMDLLFGGDFDYERGGLVVVALGMGLYLSAATLNQALLAHGRAAQASSCWVGAAAGFVLFLLLADFDDRVLQVELAFVAAAALLSASLYGLYRRA
jgi:O-antigen/teichoic acid export membrane protein